MTVRHLGVPAYAVPAAATGTFLNHVAIAAPRNGTTTHSVVPSTGTTAAGTLFTPTSGRLLVCVVEGSVTSTTPSSPAWTRPTNGDAVNLTGLYVWYRTATGTDTINTTHNASNYPAVFHFFEFAAGSSFTSCAKSTVAAAHVGACPNLTGLTGTKWVAGVKARADPDTAVSYTAAWDSPDVEILDTFTDRASSTDGYWLGIAYQSGYTSSSYQPNCTLTTTSSSTTCECLTFAVNAL